ncbi:cystatin-A-like [Mugil cephalus]|uniref:cystatin-A-like n=1 Tax=Mugil cephalus TaxID=48193 RepID=UPI001FB5C522|nr:cystatin-A-like [Mugil cephalus]
MTEVILGGWSETEPATEEIQRICDEVKGQVEERTSTKYGIFRALQYRSQVVKGRNYVIKIHAGGFTYLHVMVFEALPCDGGEKSVTGVQQGHTSQDHLKPF